MEKEHKVLEVTNEDIKFVCKHWGKLLEAIAKL